MGDLLDMLGLLDLLKFLKPIRLLTRTKRYTDLVYIYSKLIHIRFWDILKKLFGSFLPPSLPPFLPHDKILYSRSNMRNRHDYDDKYLYSRSNIRSTV